VAENKQEIWPSHPPDLTQQTFTYFYLWDMATTCNGNEQQQNAKNNDELHTEWTKTT
jgi:hypothetical protein